MSRNILISPAPTKTHYEALGLQLCCSAAEIEQSHLKITVDSHPEQIHILVLDYEGKAAADARLIAADAAIEVLLHEEQRKQYNKKLGDDKPSLWR